MKEIFKNYKMTFILIGGIILGGIIGLIAKDKAAILSPLGDLFLNLLLVVIVPLIFLTISTSIGKVDSAKRVGKILICIFAMFLVTSLVSAMIGLVSTRAELVNPSDGQAIMDALEEATEVESEDMNFLERTVSVISTNDFANLLTKDNIVALILMSVLTGISIQMAGTKGKKFLDVLDSANEVVQKLIQIIMYYAPIGLCCYFANFVGTFGASIAVGYAKSLGIYCIACLVIYFGVYTLYAFIGGGKQGIKNYWANIIPPTLTALATCSSAACIPVNTKCARDIGVSADIANTTIPLGTSFHKDGSIVGSVFKIMFLVYLFDAQVSLGAVIGLTLLATILVAALPILTIIATIIDAPATILNVVGDSATSMLVSRIVDGKDWIKK